MSFFCLMQEMYKYVFKGQAPGAEYVDRLPFNLHNTFNSATIQGRANVAKATFALVSVASLGAYILAPSVVKAANPANNNPALNNSANNNPAHTLADQNIDHPASV